MVVKKKVPKRRNAAARALQSPAYAWKVVPPGKGKGSVYKRKPRMKKEDG